MTRPVLLVVDDDEAVGRAVAQDPRRQYGRTHRVVRAQDGPGARDALRETSWVRLPLGRDA